MSINWSSMDVIDPPMDELIIIKRKGTVKIVELDSRDGVDWHVFDLMSKGFTKWSDTNG